MVFSAFEGDVGRVNDDSLFGKAAWKFSLTRDGTMT